MATVAIALERAFYFATHNLKLTDLEEGVVPFVKSRDFRGARAFLDAQSQNRLGVPILREMIDRADLSESRLEKAVETEALSRVREMESGLNYLTVLGSLSPLTGFLGTVSGMIGAFKSIAEATEVNAQIVANGIYEALITTVFGLVIALIAMTAHSLLTNLVDGFSSGVEKTCSDLITELAVSAPAGDDAPGVFPSRKSRAQESPPVDYEVMGRSGKREDPFAALLRAVQEGDPRLTAPASRAALPSSDAGAVKP
jgi:biopolymer transport protein ExbB